MTKPTLQNKNIFTALSEENPLSLVGTINAFSALLAEKAGFKALYLSGAGIANASYGIPDLGTTTLANVTEDVSRISAATELPLIVDADTGFGNPGDTVKTLINAGAAGLHIEDQIDTKRCGHRPGKVLVSATEMQDRIKASVDARNNDKFCLIARTDAYASEGLTRSIERAELYIEAGADIIFAEALTELKEFRNFSAAIKVPVLANMTEFGQTPNYDVKTLGDSGIQIVLFPLTAFRAMSAAAANVYQTIRKDGSQAAVMDSLQTREELYDILNYYEVEKQLDESLSKKDTDK